MDPRGQDMTRFRGQARQPSLPLNKITWAFSLIPLAAPVTTLIEKTYIVLNT